jgi:2-polyprenyl-3-methyl-5-hydroxy-6-metoxy-1,4-benzoquinol methylase
MVKLYTEDQIFEMSGIPQTSYGFLKRLNFIYSSIIKNIVENREYTVLDIGCGTGEYLTIPLGSLSNNLKILGIDTDSISIEYAQHKNTYENVQFQCITIEKLNRNLKYDFIIISEVLEHLDEPQSMLMEVNNLLKPGGLCFITIPNGFGPFEIENKFFVFLKDKGLLIHLQKIITAIKKLFKARPYENISLEKDSFCEDPHVQFFSYGKFINLCSEFQFELECSANRTFLAGVFSDLLINRSQFLINLNSNISNYLPHFLCSGWMFAFIVKKP